MSERSSLIEVKEGQNVVGNDLLKRAPNNVEKSYVWYDGMDQLGHLTEVGVFGIACGCFTPDIDVDRKQPAIPFQPARPSFRLDEELGFLYP